MLRHAVGKANAKSTDEVHRLHDDAAGIPFVIPPTQAPLGGQQSAVYLSPMDGRHLTPEQVKVLPAPSWLIDGWLVRNSLSMLWGEWNAGKSFLALTWAGFIGIGSWWLGQEVEQTKVLYVAGEGVAGLGPRIAAYEKGHQVYNMQGVGFIHGRVNILALEEMAELSQLCADEHYELIVWDTIARMMPGADENSAREMSLVVDRLDQLRTDVGCGSLVLHHSTKGGSTARGMSAYLGACDTELTLSAFDQSMTLTCLQQRDAERPGDRLLWRESVAGTNSATVIDGVGQTQVSLNRNDDVVRAAMRSSIPGEDFSVAELEGRSKVMRSDRLRLPETVDGLRPGVDDGRQAAQAIHPHCAGTTAMTG